MKYYYISDFFPQINIMFSIWPIITNNSYIYKKIKNQSFRKYFTIPKKTEVMVDSGSFSYYRLKNKNIKEIKLNEILKTYEIICPNYAVHNDIPVSFLQTKIDKEKLLNKNLINAKQFINKINLNKYIPIGVAQGITKEDYLKQILELYFLGYDYIGIGGIAYLSEVKINSILSYIFQNLNLKKIGIKIHIFGVGRFNILKRFPINSFDCSTPLNDSHRDKVGKRTYYYILNNDSKDIIKKSIRSFQKHSYNIKCYCTLCNRFKK
ncbi:MAG: hypothetical protein P8Y97_03240 [Candidatus Lokiarchaeota archaeon]